MGLILLAEQHAINWPEAAVYIVLIIAGAIMFIAMFRD